MGLEGVEIVMELEDSFQVQIEDKEASSIRTVGDIQKLIMKKLERRAGVIGCLSAHAFYKLRRAMVEGLARERASIQPAAALAAVLPRETRRYQMDRLAEASGLTMPKLERPRWMSMTNVVAALACGLVAGIWHGAQSSFSGFFDVFLMTMIAVFLLLHAATLPWKRELPRAATFGDFVERVRSRNFSRLMRSARQFQEQEVWHTIVAIIADGLSVNPKDIGPETRVIEDLNMG